MIFSSGDGEADTVSARPGRELIMTRDCSSSPPAHECDDPAYQAAAIPEECTCGSGWTGDRCTLPLFHAGRHSNDGSEAEIAMARRRLGFVHQETGR